MPFVTEEIWGYLPDREDMLLVSAFPGGDDGLLDTESEMAVDVWIQRVRRIRRWRDLVGVPAGKVLAARMDGEVPEFVARLARVEPGDGADEPLATIGPVQIVDAEVDRAEAVSRIEAERGRIEAEIERGERQLSNSGFVDNAPPAVVAEAREKLDRYRGELEALA
jgi:valyl-tRNA synthetase